MSDKQEASEARESIRNLIRDPVTKMLLNNSQLTVSQLETLLAEFLSSDSDVKKSQKRTYRPSKSRISRGAYNQSLLQAQNNIIRSIYTVLLLGYLELFDNASLQPFLELSDTINSYVQETRTTTGINRDAIQQLNARLLETISTLAKRQSFKDRL